MSDGSAALHFFDEWLLTKDAQRVVGSGSADLVFKGWMAGAKWQRGWSSLSEAEKLKYAGVYDGQETDEAEGAQDPA